MLPRELKQNLERMVLSALAIRPRISVARRKRFCLFADKSSWRKSMRGSLIFCALTFGAVSCLANAIVLPGDTQTIQAISTTGTSFTYMGTLTQADTIQFTESGSSCLQTGFYCVNGAGVVTVAGTTGVGGTSSFSATYNGTTATWNFGAVLMEISGEGAAQIFPADAAHGLGSASPSQTLTLDSTSLASLGFGSFSITDPTITFLIADDLYTDNSGQFTLTQSSTTATTPEPSTALLAISALGLAFLVSRIARKRSAAR
jgi:hypothetical protein